MTDLPHLEGLATGLYLDLGLDPQEAESPATIARKWLGADALVVAPATLRVPACTFFVAGARRIAVKPHLPPAARRFWIAHELGHAILARAGEEDSERAADYLGAALMAPRPLALAYDDDWRSLAADIGSTQTLAALRTAEVLGLPRAVVTPQRVYLRGPESFVWPLARRQIERFPGVRKTPLTDDERRFVLDVEDAG